MIIEFYIVYFFYRLSLVNVTTPEKQKLGELAVAEFMTTRGGSFPASPVSVSNYSYKQKMQHIGM